MSLKADTALEEKIGCKKTKHQVDILGYCTIITEFLSELLTVAFFTWHTLIKPISIDSNWHLFYEFCKSKSKYL